MQGCSIDGVYHSLATRIKLDFGCVSTGAYSDAYDVWKGMHWTRS